MPEVLTGPPLYSESIFAKGFVALLAPLSLVMVGLLGYQLLVGSIGNKPAPNLLLVSLALVFGALAVNFSRLTINIHEAKLSVAYGLIKYNILLENITGYYRDETSALRYGGAGIRISKVKGKTRLVFNLLKGPRVVVTLRAGTGKFAEFVFTTQNPDQVLALLKLKLPHPARADEAAEGAGAAGAEESVGAVGVEGAAGRGR